MHAQQLLLALVHEAQEKFFRAAWQILDARSKEDLDQVADLLPSLAAGAFADRPMTMEEVKAHLEAAMCVARAECAASKMVTILDSDGQVKTLH